MSLVTEEQLRTLRFFAITPDGRRIPTSEICSDPVNNVMRWERRAFVVVAAVKPDDDVYWTQLFYCSTGTSSGRQKTWFPCDGIIDKRSITSGRYGGWETMRIPFGFVNKIPYTFVEERGIGYLPGQRRPSPPPTPKILNKAGLFEGDTIRDRFGSLSQQFASESFGDVSACYERLVSGQAPDADPNDINDYMFHYDAMSVARFRKLGVFIPMFPGIDEQEVMYYYKTIEANLAEFEVTRDPTNINKQLDNQYEAYQTRRKEEEENRGKSPRVSPPQYIPPPSGDGGGGGSSSSVAAPTPFLSRTGTSGIAPPTISTRTVGAPIPLLRRMGGKPRKQRKTRRRQRKTKQTRRR